MKVENGLRGKVFGKKPAKNMLVHLYENNNIMYLLVRKPLVRGASGTVHAQDMQL